MTVALSRSCTIAISSVLPLLVLSVVWETKEREPGSSWDGVNLPQEDWRRRCVLLRIAALHTIAGDLMLAVGRSDYDEGAFEVPV